MALKRLIPSQDTFILNSSLLKTEENFGSDEILELGYSTTARSISRILMEFNIRDIKSLISSIPGNYKAILHLTVSEARNLPSTFSIIVSSLSQAWTEGIGRTGDSYTEGATWDYTGLYNGEGDRIRWDIPGTAIWSVYDGEFAVQGPILNVLDGEGSVIETAIEAVVNGGRAYWQYGPVRFFGREIYSRDLMSDVELDVTEAVASWVELPDLDNNGLLLRFGNEAECRNYKAQLSFYSKETHTIYQPYLEIRWDDSTYIPGSLPECQDFFGTYANNLREKYTVGDVAEIRLSVKDRYASRAWSTGSIYQINQILPETSYWGIKDEYTNEMAVNFEPESTKISADDSGSFFILDTGNLEPERYYRLLFQVEKDGQKLTIDNKNIFRVGRDGGQ